MLYSITQCWCPPGPHSWIRTHTPNRWVPAPLSPISIKQAYRYLLVISGIPFGAVVRHPEFCLFVAFVYPDHDKHSITKFVTRLHPQGWIILKSVCSFPDYVDLAIGTCSVLIGIHNSTQSKVEPLLFWMPPTWHPLLLSLFICQPFNVSDYQVSYVCNNLLFDTAFESNGAIATLTSATMAASFPSGLVVLYYLHRRDSNLSCLNGSAVDSLYPQFDGSPNTNLFCGHFGIEFNCGDNCYVRSISPFKFASCSGFTNNLW